MQYHSPDYFTLPSLPWMINVIIWFHIGTWSAALIPHLVPYHLFGPAGTAIRLIYLYCPYFAYFAAIGGTLAHLFEAFYSWYLCGKKGIKGSARTKWFISTAIFGGASLYELVRFKPYHDGNTHY